jgi:hypothetical protein
MYESLHLEDEMKAKLVKDKQLIEEELQKQ